MNRKVILTGLLAVALAVPGAWAADKAVSKTLQSGKYSAKVVAIPCAACPPEIEKTLKAQPAIDEVSVDQKSSTVRFSVKAGAQVQLSDLQKALKTASEQMGMGADYRLKNVKKAG